MAHCSGRGCTGTLITALVSCLLCAAAVAPRVGAAAPVRRSSSAPLLQPLQPPQPLQCGVASAIFSTCPKCLETAHATGALEFWWSWGTEIEVDTAALGPELTAASQELFVPMLWGEGNPPSYDFLSSGSTHVMGFNEPGKYTRTRRTHHRNLVPGETSDKIACVLRPIRAFLRRRLASAGVRLRGWGVARRVVLRLAAALRPLCWHCQEPVRQPVVAVGSQQHDRASAAPAAATHALIPAAECYRLCCRALAAGPPNGQGLGALRVGHQHV